MGSGIKLLKRRAVLPQNIRSGSSTGSGRGPRTQLLSVPGQPPQVIRESVCTDLILDWAWISFLYRLEPINLATIPINLDRSFVGLFLSRSTLGVQSLGEHPIPYHSIVLGIILYEPISELETIAACSTTMDTGRISSRSYKGIQDDQKAETPNTVLHRLLSHPVFRCNTGGGIGTRPFYIEPGSRIELALSSGRASK